MDNIFVESLIDDSNPLIVKNVLLCGNESKNGRVIPPEAFVNTEHVRKLYSNVPVYMNHKQTREVEDIAGEVINPRMENGKPYADIDTSFCPKGPLLLNLAQKKMAKIGMSHVAAYQLRSDRRHVEKVTQVHSVDVVVNPATTTTFFEGETLMDAEYLQKRLDAIEADLKKANETIAGLNSNVTALESEKASLTDQVKVFTEDNQKLKSELDQYKVRAELEQRRAEVVVELKEAFKESIQSGKIRLEDDVLFSKVFMESLESCPSKDGRTAMISAHKKLVETVSSKPLGGYSSVRGEQTHNTNTFDAAAELKRTDLYN